MTFNRADCLDCEEAVELHSNRCPKCGGDAWVRPAPLSFEEALKRRREHENKDEEVMRRQTR
jgi:hypothetical protein